MSDDILNRYICYGCKNTKLDFTRPNYACACGVKNWRLFNTAKTVSKTASVLGSQYDSVDTLNEDVDKYTQEDQENRDWKKIEDSRRG